MKRASPKLNDLDQKQVHQMAFESLEKHLSLNSKGPQSSPQMVWNILLAAAANQTSIDYECGHHEGAASANTILGVIEDSFELQSAEIEVNEALWHDLNPRCWKHAVSVAVDLVAVPYYGQPAHDLNEVRRGKAQPGTTPLSCVCHGLRDSQPPASDLSVALRAQRRISGQRPRYAQGVSGPTGHSGETVAGRPGILLGSSADYRRCCVGLPMLWMKGWVSQRPSSYQPLQLNDFEQIESDCGVLNLA
jgi:hypothetical protein